MDDRTIPTVRVLFDEGLPLRGISAKLGITLDEARARLRSSYPDSVDREGMAPETQARLGAGYLGGMERTKGGGMKLAQKPHTGRSISTSAVLRGSRRRRACAGSVSAERAGKRWGFKVLRQAYEREDWTCVWFIKSITSNSRLKVAK